MITALMGLGAIGVPIAQRLYTAYREDFFIVADEERKNRMLKDSIYINNELFSAGIFSDLDPIKKDVDVFIVCIKNYSIISALRNMEPFIGENTIILPLQNGIFAYDFFKERFPNNIVFQGFVQGPNTERTSEGFVYTNPGEIHIGSEDYPEEANRIVTYLSRAGIPALYEKNIKRMVWKKWMLNVAGNSITALTGADYSLFKHHLDLQKICRSAMEEFLQISKAEGVELNEGDIDDIIDYYVTYVGNKKTSMLMDVINERKTENDYLAGTALEIANKHNLVLPIITSLYYLLDVKEEVYMEKKGIRTMDGLFSEGVEYSDALRLQMNDVSRKMEDKEFAKKICSGQMTDQLLSIMKYASENTEFYAPQKGSNNIHDYPVMNKTTLNTHYEEIMVRKYENVKTHRMYTSGSTGIPFSVVQDMAKRERHLADLKFFGAMAGYADHDPMCYLRAKPTATIEEQERDNIWQLDICNLNEQNLTDYFHVMVEKKCTALIAYPSTLETAVDFWSRHFTNESHIKSIISTSETLTEDVRNKLKAFFGNNVGIYARYSNTEQGILGQEDGIGGEYRLNWASYYFEILKMDSDEPADEGELGRIVITDLYNKAFPMIRYDTGDVAKMRNGKDGRFPILYELYGRRMDLIYDLKGEVVSPFLLCRTMRLSHGIEQWQFIQEDEKTYTLKVTSTTDTRPNVDKEIEEFKRTLGQDAVIRVEYVKDIPILNSLKRKLIVSKISNLNR